MLWFSLYDYNEYKSLDKPFVDTKTIYGIESLQNNWEIILKEFLNYRKQHEIDVHFNKVMVEKPKSWKVRSLRVWGTEMYQIQKHFPQTMKLLNSIPNVLTAGFNILDSHSKIKPHCGDTNAIYRCHLGLKIPKEYHLCTIKVGNEKLNWQDGKLLAFEDAIMHEAWNDSSEERIILLFDVLKPEFVNQKNKICATILTSFYLQQVGNFLPKLYNLDRSYFKIFLSPFVMFFRLALPIRNWVKK